MLTLTRREGWPDGLFATIARHRRAPFVWGETDCATLFADCVAAVTGVNPLSEINGWSSEAEALKRLSDQGFTSMAEFCDNRFPTIPVSAARRGDLVLPASPPPLMCPAIVTGAEAVSRDRSGWVVAPLGLMAFAWKVG